MTNQVQTDTFLNAEEMVDLTGYKTGSKQCQQLRQQGIPFFTNARGYPRVARDVILGKKPSKPPKPKQEWRPNITQT